MIWPRLRRMKFISRTTIATILIEEMDSAVPRNSDGTSRAARHWAGANPAATDPAAKPQAKGTAMPRQRDRHGRACRFAHQLEIGFHAGEQQQHQDADLRQAVDHAFLCRIGRENEILRLGPDPAEQRWPQDQARQQIAHQGGLAEALHALRPARGPPAAAAPPPPPAGPRLCRWKRSHCPRRSSLGVTFAQPGRDVRAVKTVRRDRWAPSA